MKPQKGKSAVKTAAKAQAEGPDLIVQPKPTPAAILRKSLPTTISQNDLIATLNGVKRPGGNLKIDWVLVERLAHIHCTVQEIAGVLGVNKAALSSHPEFAYHFNKGMDGGKSSLRRTQFEVAERGNAAMLIFLGTQYLNQQNNYRHQVSGVDGGPIQVEEKKPDLHKLTIAELTTLKMLVVKAGGGSDD